jgi:hypothetical protein
MMKGFHIDVLQRIIAMNDDQRMSFPQIARWLSVHLGATEPTVRGTITPSWIEEAERFANEAKALIIA